MAKSDLRIDILGTSVTISTDEDPDYLRALLDKFRRTIENVQRISGLKDPLKTAVLTGFLLSDDLEKAGKTAPPEKTGENTGQSAGGESAEAERLTLGMISRLDEALLIPAAAPFTVEAAEPEDKGVQAVSRDGAEKTAGIPAFPAEDNAGSASAETASRNNVDPKSASFFKLENAVKNYSWGSPEWIPALLGQKNVSRIPWAELWMGVNPAGPSRVTLQSGADEAAPSLLLSELIQSAPELYLGKEITDSKGGLPFLFKVEAAAKPLSIQVHPNREQAGEGFERENSEGIPPDAPNRNYRDSNHKPEIISALTTFAALCGFREKREISVLLQILLQNSEGLLNAGLESLCSALEREDTPLESFLAALFGLPDETREALGPFIRTRQSLLQRDYPEYRDEWGLCSYLAGLYPGDPGILAPLYLNIIELAPGEAMYLPAGVFHAYIHGLGIELMADSDNVLRGGLTSKYIDKRELFKILDFSPYKPEILGVPEPAPAWFTYPSPGEEFRLSVMRGTGSALPYPEAGPAIVLVIEGSAVIEDGAGNELPLEKGESVFVPAGKQGMLVFSGNFTAYVAAGRAGLAPGETGTESFPPAQNS